MLRATSLSLCLFILAACSAEVKQAKVLLTESLAIPKEVEFRRMKTYPGDVVCGEYSAFTSHITPKQDFTPFITVRGELDREPDESDLAIYCTDKPADALLAQTGIGPFTSENAALGKITADYAALTSALERYNTDNYKYPTATQGLQGLVSPIQEGPHPPRNFPEGGYLSEIPDDPWGQPYTYTVEQWGRTKGYFELLTLGKDNSTGGEGENADVSSKLFPYLDHIAHVLGQR